jgi:hypothetical protein
LPDRRESLYIFDTNSLIDLHRRTYPKATFPGLWSDIEKLCSRKCLVIHELVREELQAMDDELLAWVRKHPATIANIDEDQVESVRKVLTAFPGLVRPKKVGPQADAFIVALAVCLQSKELRSFDSMQREVVIVSQEKRDTDPTLKRKIPNACEHFKIPCLTLLELFSRESWRY